MNKKLLNKIQKFQLTDFVKKFQDDKKCSINDINISNKGLLISYERDSLYFLEYLPNL